MLAGETPCERAIERKLQWVASAGLEYSVVWTISRTVSALIDGLPRGPDAPG